MKIHALINCYNDSQFISATLHSLRDSVDSIIIADGAYELYYQQYKKYNPLAQPWSTDGTLEIIQCLKGPELTILRCQKPWENQTVKRTALLEAVPDNDWFIIIDTDEMLIGDVDEGMDEIIESGCVVGRVPFCNLGADIDRMHYFWHPRIFKKLHGMKYIGTHWQLRDHAGRQIEGTYPVWWTQTFVMLHFKLLKTPERILPHEDYMRLLQDQGWLELSQGIIK